MNEHSGSAFDYTDNVHLAAPDVPISDVKDFGYTQEITPYCGIDVPKCIVFYMVDGRSIICHHNGCMVETETDENGEEYLVELTVFYKEYDEVVINGYSVDESGQMMGIGHVKRSLN